MANMKKMERTILGSRAFIFHQLVEPSFSILNRSLHFLVTVSVKLGSFATNGSKTQTFVGLVFKVNWQLIVSIAQLIAYLTRLCEIWKSFFLLLTYVKNYGGKRLLHQDPTIQIIRIETPLQDWQKISFAGFGFEKDSNCWVVDSSHNSKYLVRCRPKFR